MEQKAWQPADAVRAGDSKADRLSRAAAAFLDGRLRAKLGVDPAEPLRRLDLHYLMLWQGNRTADDFWGPAAGQQEPYFASVARAYGESAEKLRKAVPRWEAAVGQLVEAARQGVQPAVEPKNVFVDRNDPAVRHAFSVTVPEHTPKGTAAVYVQDSAGLLPLLSQSQTPLRRMGVAVAAAGQVAHARRTGFPTTPACRRPIACRRWRCIAATCGGMISTCRRRPAWTSSIRGPTIPGRRSWSAANCGKPAP